MGVTPDPVTVATAVDMDRTDPQQVRPLRPPLQPKQHKPYKPLKPLKPHKQSLLSSRLHFQMNQLF
jgi:hypothetical protein